MPAAVFDQLQERFGGIGTAVLVSDRADTQVWRIDTDEGRFAVKCDSGGRRAADELAVLRALSWPVLAAWGDLDGQAWFATRWAAGRTTADVWSAVREATSHHPQVRRRTLLATLDLCGAVAQLHDAGWLHGDLRPEHCLHAREGVRLVGFSGATGPEGALPTAAADPGRYLAADPDLLAPELCAALSRGELPSPTRESEVYTLAAMIRKCWTGESPLDFAASGSPEPRSDDERRARIADGLPLRPVPEHCAWPGLESRLAAALAADPEGRPDVARFTRMLGRL